MGLIVGLDGGGTSTRCAVSDGEKILGLGISGGCNIVRLGEETARASIHAAIHEAFAKASLKPEAAKGACIGVAGSGVPRVRQAIHEILREILPCPVNVVGDQEIAHESVFKGSPGVIVISGTGSIAFGRNGAGIQARAGGHGLIVGDEGSGDWIGRAAISACLRALDRGSEPELLADLVKAFGCATMRDLIQAANAVPLAPFASLLPLIVEASESGDATAVEVLVAAAGELAYIGGTVAVRLQMTDAFCVAMAGGVFEHSSVVCQSFAKALQAKYSGASVTAQLADPLQGALTLAARAAL
jgi:glucosamine kinase